MSEPEPFPQLQARLLALASVPYAVWIRAQCARWGIAWREMYATPIDKPQHKEARR